MQIQPVNNNYNINNRYTFKAKNIHKVVTKLNNKSTLKKFERESKQVPQEFLALRNGCLVAGGIMGLAATFGMLHILPPMVLPVIALVGGLSYALISMNINNRPTNVKEGNDKIAEKKDAIEQDNFSNEVENSQQNKDTNASEKTKATSKLDNMTVDEIIASFNSNLIKEAINADKIDLTDFFLQKIDYKLKDSDYAEVLDNFVQKQLVEDNNRELAMHKYSAQQISMIIHNLRDYPDIIAELMCAKNINGETPIHKFLDNDYSDENFDNICKIFYELHTPSLEGRVLPTVFETKNANGISAEGWLKKQLRKARSRGEQSPFAKTMLSLLSSCKRIHFEINGEYKPYIPNSDLRRQAKIADIINSQSEINYESIMRILNNEDVQKTKGLDLNLHDNYTAEIIGFLINSANEKERQNVIAKLKELNRLDYDKVDNNGISTIELVMNAEDDELLELIKNSTFKYRPDLDYAYNNIQNSDFKEKVRNMKFEFVDLKNAVSLMSIENLEKYICHTDSPLYNKKIHGREMQVPDYITMRSSFFYKYNEFYFRLFSPEQYL